MKYDDTNKIYMRIGESRLLDIRVFLDDIEVYSGMVEDAPEEIKKIYYTKVELADKYNYYAYNSLQKV